MSGLEGVHPHAVQFVMGLIDSEVARSGGSARGYEFWQEVARLRDALRRSLIDDCDCCVTPGR